MIKNSISTNIHNYFGDAQKYLVPQPPDEPRSRGRVGLQVHRQPTSPLAKMRMAHSPTASLCNIRTLTMTEAAVAVGCQVQKPVPCIGLRQCALCYDGILLLGLLY